MWVSDSGDKKIYAYSVSTKVRDAGKDFNNLSSLGCSTYSPTGLWSDGTTMWVYSLSLPLELYTENLWVWSY